MVVRTVDKDPFLMTHLNTTFLANSADNKLKYFSYLSKRTGSDISCKLSPVETICMKYQILFSGKNKTKYFNLFVCVEVLQPSQPSGVMSRAVSLPNPTFTGQA